MKKGISIILVIAMLVAMTSSFVVSAYPASTLSSFNDGNISLELDKSTAKAGDIIKAYIKIKDISNFAGYQVNIKYDPAVLQAVNPDTLAPLGTTTMPKNGNLLINPEYGALSGVLNKIEEGILNFGKAYSYLDDYKLVNSPEETGVLAEIGFKVLKEQPTTVKFDNTSTMPSSLSGTMLFDWSGNIISGYTIVQPEVINSSVTNPSPAITPSTGSIKMDLDKNTALVGDIIVAEIKVDNFNSIAGYQLNIKYDPEVFQPIDFDTNTPYKNTTMPKDGTILLNSDYGIVSAVSNNLVQGTLNFGKSYTYLDDYKSSGVAEKSGTIAKIAFKTLKAASSTYIEFAESLSMPGSTKGTMCFDWNGNNVLGYQVIQSGAISISGQSVKPSPTASQVPASPTHTPLASATPATSPISNGSIEIDLDKSAVKVGDIIKAVVKVDSIDNLSGFQVNIKYNPDLLQAVNPDTGEPLTKNTMPKDGTLIVNPNYGAFSVAVNKPSEGVLNFSKVYTYLNEYKNSRNPESTGALATIGFKALKAGDATIKFEDSISMPSSLTGTMMFDWNSIRISGYKVIQPELVSITGSVIASPSPSSSATPASPKPSVVPSETPISDGQIELKLDKNQAKVGDIIKAAVNIKDIDNFAGYQVNIKYDPSVLQAVNPVTGEAMADRTMPADGTILINTEYGVISAVLNDTSEGVLNFGKSYTYLDAYKLGTDPEESGTLAVIGFKVLKKQDTYIGFENSIAMPSSISGTSLFDWNGNAISGYKVVNPDVIKISQSEEPIPSATPSANPSLKPSSPKPTGPVSSDSHIELELDKNNASVGDIIKATVKVNDIANFAGYQINIKYDPNVLQPVNPETGAAYSARTPLANGELIINSEYGATSVAAHKLSQGILNFAQLYTFIDDYRMGGIAEETGVLGVIGFKVLKNEKTTISLKDAASMPGSISGTFLFDWYGGMISDYKVIQPAPINGSAVSKSYIKLELDKDNASVGEIIKATIKVNDIENFAGYQVNIKYDPSVLQPVKLNTGAAYSTRTSISGNELLTNDEYGPMAVSSHKLSQGILNFGHTYTYLDDYRMGGIAEKTGVLGVIGFKVLKNEKTTISFEKDETLMPKSTSGTYLFDWYGGTISDYEVIQPAPINGNVVSGSYISLDLDKNNASVGEIVKATVRVKDIENFAGYQVNIAYDPNMLQPVNSVTGAPYSTRSTFENSKLFSNSEYGPTNITAHDLTKGFLNFSRAYTYMNDYKTARVPEETGILGEISFKVLKTGNTKISFKESSSMPNSISGTFLFDWNGNAISDYSVVQPDSIN